MRPLSPTPPIMARFAVRPVCYGDGKIFWAERLAGTLGLDLARSYFYTDSITDLPVLERVGEPRIVNPDPRLGRVATRRGWPTFRIRLEDRTPVFVGAEGARQAAGS